LLSFCHRDYLLIIDEQLELTGRTVDLETHIL
jgi:hypothetical protein